MRLPRTSDDSANSKEHTGRVRRSTSAVRSTLTERLRQLSEGTESGDSNESGDSKTSKTSLPKRIRAQLSKLKVAAQELGKTEAEKLAERDAAETAAREERDAIDSQFGDALYGLLIRSGRVLPPEALEELRAEEALKESKALADKEAEARAERAKAEKAERRKKRVSWIQSPFR